MLRRVMNITIVNKHKTDTLGGSELQCDFIATELAKRGHRVHYVAPGGSQRDYGTTYSVIPCKKNDSDIADKVLKTNPEIVYWRFNKNYFHDSVKRIQNANCKIIFAASSAYDVHLFLYRRNLPFRKNVRRFFKGVKEQWGMRYVDAVVVNNREHLNKLSVKPQIYIPNGMSEDFVEFKWSKPYCAWIANLKKIKRPELFVELASDLKSMNVDCVMVGDIQESEYEWIKNRANLPENLHYLGPKSFEEVNGILKNSLVHVHTCLAEGFPNVFIQAWVQEIPSVTYGFDPTNYITDKNLGYSAHENRELFRKRVSELIQNPGKRKELGKNAKLFAMDMFRIKKSVTELEKFMTEITSRE